MRGGVWDMSSTCVQGGRARALGGYHANVSLMEPHSPAPAWNMHQSVIPKQERMDDERNDSGINSGSDFHSSSPGSDNSQDYHPPVHFSTPMTSGVVAFNPLTPPNSESSAAIKSESIDSSETMVMLQTPTEPKTPTAYGDEDEEEGSHPLRRLEMTFEKSGFLSPKETSDGGHSDGEAKEPWDESEESVRMPTVNTHGKVKKFKCKQCDFVAITKMDFWAHSRAHIKTDKILTCPKCPFVTEYKHHLEYHLRNHFGSKPFKCDKCSYTCVNKSMLNSHMKSHSNVYQYRCQECSYATKYCHSLKLHLRKYNHKPAMVLNPDGTPNPLPIIDVYGTRRGPKQKSSAAATISHKTEPDLSLASPPPPISATLPPPVQQQPPHHPFMTLMNQLPFAYPFFSGALGNQLFLAQQLAHQQGKVITTDEEEDGVVGDTVGDGVLDLSKPEAPTKNRRKGKAFKLDRSQMRPYSDDEEIDADTGKADVATTTTPVADSTCRFCGIAFGDVVLYTMHMGYHGYKDPFTCNMCGEQCNDKVAFFLHIARNPHT